MNNEDYINLLLSKHIITLRDYLLHSIKLFEDVISHNITNFQYKRKTIAFLENINMLKEEFKILTIFPSSLDTTIKEKATCMIKLLNDIDNLFQQKEIDPDIVNGVKLKLEEINNILVNIMV